MKWLPHFLYKKTYSFTSIPQSVFDTALATVLGGGESDPIGYAAESPISGGHPKEAIKSAFILFICGWLYPFKIFIKKMVEKIIFLEFDLFAEKCNQ